MAPQAAMVAATVPRSTILAPRTEPRPRRLLPIDRPPSAAHIVGRHGQIKVSANCLNSRAMVGLTGFGDKKNSGGRGAAVQFLPGEVDASMAADIVDEFARYLLAKYRIPGDLSVKLASSKGGQGETKLRDLWELTELSANDFADEVANFYDLPRLNLPELVAAPSAAAQFSRRFLRETLVYPFSTPDGRYYLAVADPGDEAAIRAAEIVLGGPVGVAVASFEDIATVLTERIGEY